MVKWLKWNVGTIQEVDPPECAEDEKPRLSLMLQGKWCSKRSSRKSLHACLAFTKSYGHSTPSISCVVQIANE